MIAGMAGAIGALLVGVDDGARGMDVWTAPELPAYVYGYGGFGRQEEGRVLLSPRPYPRGVVDNVRRPGFNGRIWTERPIIGGVEYPFHTAFGEPGPEAFGEYDDPYVTVPVRVNTLAVSISPWERMPEGLRTLEQGRQEWLKEHGYVGGVRTFVNDLYYWTPEIAAEEAGEPEPSAIIPIPEEMPRTRGRIQVDAGEAGSDIRGAAAILRTAGAMRISWPEGTPGEIVARVERTGGWIGAETRVVSGDR